MVRGALAALALLWLSRPVAAGDNDLVPSRLATRITDDTGRVVGAVGDSLALRALASQLGVALARTSCPPRTPS